MRDSGAFGDDIYRSVAQTAIGAVTSEQPHSVEPLGRGNRKQTAIARFERRGPVVLQLCEERTWLRTESVVLSRIREQTDVPVPPVLASGVTDGVAFMVTAFVPGEDLHRQFTQLQRDRQRTLSRTFGRYLGTLHEQFGFDRYGTLVVEDGGLVAQSEDWSGWFAEYGRTALDRLPVEFDPIRAELRALFGEQTRERPPAATLFPWDFRPGNAIVADGRITAILDWEAPMAAAPALSAAKAEYLVARWYVDEPTALRTAFVDGYETVRAYPDVRPVHRAGAIAASAVDSTGTVTNPGYPELDRKGAVAFHREALAALL